MIVIRMLKIGLVLFVALQGLAYFAQNMANLDAVFGVVSTVLSQEGHEYYPSSVVPAVTSPVLVWITIAVILAGELLVGLLGAKGACDMWRQRAAPPEAFERAKTYALLGCGMAVIVWFGLFIVIGGALFQMWQTDLGRASLSDAMTFLVPSGLILIFIALRE